ncbi:MAG TPA: DUF3365 domain-containing protein [Allocoleopsis sp.]
MTIVMAEPLINSLSFMFKNLKLASKFTLLLSVVFISTIAISGIILFQAVEQKAEGEVNSQGRLLMEMMNSVRDYTSQNVNPLLAARLETEPKFIPETVPDFSATEVFKILNNNPAYKDFHYKEAVINPTNIRDTSDDFETKIIQQFRQQPKFEERTGFRKLAGETIFYDTRPIRIKQTSCLRCHSSPRVAPKSLLATYGSENGFGWKLNDIVGIQIIYVPAETVFALAHRYLVLVMGIFIAIFAIFILLINLLLKWAVVQPIRPMARLAKKISSEQFSADKDEDSDIASLRKVAKNSDELGQLARLFQQMAHAIYVREQSFAQQLQQLRSKSERIQAKNRELSSLKVLLQKSQVVRNKTEKEE